MKLISILILLLFSGPSDSKYSPGKIFDVHIHAAPDAGRQIEHLNKAGVYKAAISTSWDLITNYKNQDEIELLFGLMFPCPNGKVPYSLQPCFPGGEDFPDISFVEQQIKDGEIDFFGEILSQYYGISSSDSLLNPYYSLAEKYKLPVGIHTGSAGPNHGSPDFREELGNPELLENMIKRFPTLKIWIMHSGEPFFREAVSILKSHENVYADISVISNPDIVPAVRFEILMKEFIDEGLEDRLMFGSDNGDINKCIEAVENLKFLTPEQKSKIYFKNAERFFKKD